MKKRFIFCFFTNLIFSFHFLFAIADWTVLLYANADNDLGEYLEYNIVDMAWGVLSGGPGSLVNVLAQVDWLPDYTFPVFDFELWWVHPSSNLGSFRYEIYYDELVGACIAIKGDPLPDMGQNVAQELIDAMQWAVTNYPAQHYMLVLAGHARGIQDPAHDEWVKSILFDDTQETYMNNQQLAYALSQIKTTVLDGKRLDILGMDACLTGMLEVAYQVKDYADLLVTNEASGPGFGWDYENTLLPMILLYMTPLQVANNIVSTFDYWYHVYWEFEFYTHSAVDLSKIDLLKQNVDKVVSYINEFRELKLIEINSKKINDGVNKARSNAQEFQFLDFIDLYTFYSDLSGNLAQYSKTSHVQDSEPHSRLILDEDYTFSVFRSRISHKPTIPPPIRIRPTGPPPTQLTLPSLPPRIWSTSRLRIKTEGEKKVDILRNALAEGMALIESVVTANVFGTEFPRAHGVSIYFPRNEIHFSYPITKFAEDGLWNEFLQDYV